MADITVTAALVIAQAGATVKHATCTTTITAGHAVYRDADTSNKLRKCLNTGVASANCYGIALNNASSGQPCDVCTAGRIYIGADALAGHVYGIGSSSGSIGDISDTNDDSFMTVIGICRIEGYLDINIDVPGVAKAAAP